MLKKYLDISSAYNYHSSMKFKLLYFAIALVPTLAAKELSSDIDLSSIITTQNKFVMTEELRGVGRLYTSSVLGVDSLVMACSDEILAIDDLSKELNILNEQIKLVKTSNDLDGIKLLELRKKIMEADIAERTQYVEKLELIIVKYDAIIDKIENGELKVHPPQATAPPRDRSRFGE